MVVVADVARSECAPRLAHRILASEILSEFAIDRFFVAAHRDER